MNHQLRWTCLFLIAVVAWADGPASRPHRRVEVRFAEDGNEVLIDFQTRKAKVRALGAKAVLIKGGHAQGPECVDLLISDQPQLRLTAKRIDTRCTHGTGCTLSAAIAAQLAKGDYLAQAVTKAHEYLQSAIAQAERLRIGRGHGPVHHFHKLWVDLA